jgi:hypothetical protein
MSIEKEIMEILIKHSKKEFDYPNATFLADINELLWDYFGIQDDDVDEWIDSMWSA